MGRIERVALKHIHLYVLNRLLVKYLYNIGSSTQCSVMMQQGGRGGVGRRFKVGEDICIFMADAHC